MFDKTSHMTSNSIVQYILFTVYIVCVHNIRKNKFPFFRPTQSSFFNMKCREMSHKKANRFFLYTQKQTENSDPTDP